MSKKKDNQTNFNNSLTQAIQAYIDSGKATECFNLASMAKALTVGNPRVYSAARTPITGVAYDPNTYNWDALERFVLRRLDPKETMEDFVARVFNINEELKNSPRPSTRDKRIHIKLDDGTEKVYPGRRGAVQVCEGAALKLIDDPAEYRVVAVSPTHVVLSRKDTPELFLLSNWTYNAKVDRESIVFPCCCVSDKELPREMFELVTAGVVVEQ